MRLQSMNTCRHRRHRPTPILSGLLRAWLVAAGVLAAALPASAAGSCQARSGPRTAALVELYTSEGCSSCPPADQQLSTLRRSLDADAEVVPLALHVDYWDGIGWKDPFAQAAFGRRHSALVTANQHRTVYTPHFFVSGGELREWRADLRQSVRRVNAQPAQAEVQLQATLTPQGVLQLGAEARSLPTATGTTGDTAQLYVAVTEDGLSTRVPRGENGGRTLAHDAVVRRWLGPVRLEGGSARLQQAVMLEPGWNRNRLSLVAFVQQERSGRVLQALAAPGCAGSS